MNLSIALKKRSYLYLFILLGMLYTPFQLNAQKVGQERLDSLVGSIAGVTKDTEKVWLLNNISFSYYTIDPGKGIAYGKDAALAAEKINWKFGLAISYNSLAVNYMVLSDNPSALNYYLKAVKISEEIHDSMQISRCYENIGLLYHSISDYPKALEYYFKAIDIRKHKKNVVNYGTYGNIGETYRKSGDLNKALEYLHRSLKESEERKDYSWIGLNLTNIGCVYSVRNDYVQSINYNFRAIGFFEKIGSRSAIQTNMMNVAGNLADMVRNGMTDYKDSMIPAGKQAKLQMALQYTEKALAMANEIGNIITIKESYKMLSNVQALSGDNTAALQSLNQSYILNDSFYAMDNQKKLADIENRQTIEKKDKEIEINKLEVAKKQNERIFLVAGIGLLLVVVIVIARNYRIQKASAKLLAKEKQKSENLLLNILPAEVADELKEKGGAEARYFDDVTILFTDFVNFTGAVERMGSRQLIQELDTCFKAFDEIISKHSIEKIKTIGDAYLAVSGLPITNEKHAEHIVNAALDIRDFMLKRKAALGDDTFEVRVGIHSGPVVAGIVGVKKFAYDIWGDTVNTAARMEQKSEPGKINISQTTYELVKDKFSCAYRGEIAAKNKGMLKMYFVN